MKPLPSRPNGLLLTLRYTPPPEAGRLEAPAARFEWSGDRIAAWPSDRAEDPLVLVDTTDVSVSLSRTEHVAGEQEGLGELFGDQALKRHRLHAEVRWASYTWRLQADAPPHKLADLPIQSRFGDEVGFTDLVGLLSQLTYLGAEIRVPVVVDVADSRCQALDQLGIRAQEELARLWPALLDAPDDPAVYERIEAILVTNGLWEALADFHDHFEPPQGRTRTVDRLQVIARQHAPGRRLSDLWLLIGQYLEAMGRPDQANTAYFLSFKNRGSGLHLEALEAKLALDARKGDFVSYREKKGLHDKLQAIGVARSLIFARVALEALRADRVDKAIEALRHAQAQAATPSQGRLMALLVERLELAPDDVAERLERLTAYFLGELGAESSGGESSGGEKLAEEAEGEPGDEPVNGLDDLAHELPYAGLIEEDEIHEALAEQEPDDDIKRPHLRLVELDDEDEDDDS